MTEQDGPRRNVTEPAAPMRWPEGIVAAAALTFDVDAESAILSADPSTATRMTVMSHQAYGPLTGVPRLLRLLDRHALHATFFVPGYTAERYPSVVERIAAGGHEIAHHSYLHESTIGMGADEEARMLDRGLRALESVGCARPIGYRAPLWELNYHTPGLLLDRGFLYDSSMMDCDVPYLLAEGGGPGARNIVEIPIHWVLDDWGEYAYVPGVSGSGLLASPAQMLGMWTHELEAFHREGGCFVLTNHPFASGRPSRVDALEHLVERMESLEGLWITTLGEIAEHTRRVDPEPRVFPQPELGDGQVVS